MATTNLNKKKVTTKSGPKPTPSKSVNPEKTIKDYAKGVMYNASGNSSKKTKAGTKKKVTPPTAFANTRKFGNLLLKDLKAGANYGKDMLESGAKTYIESEKRMLKNLKAGAKVVMPILKKGAKALAKKVTVKNVAKVLNSPKSNKFIDAGPKYARGGVAKKMRKYQGDVGGSEVKTTTPTAPVSPTTVSRPAATTPTPTPTAPAATTAPAQRTVASIMQENMAAGMSEGQARRTAMIELGYKKKVDPNKVFDAANTAGNIVNSVIQNRNQANNGGGGMSGPGEFQRNGGMVKRKLMKASEGVIVKMNGNQPVQKRAGSKGVRSGVNPKAKASKVTRGRVGGTSTAPKKALPKAGYGMMMKSKKC